MTGSEDITRAALWANTRLVVLDVETTGLRSTSRILAVAAYVVENGATVESWSSLINPGLALIGATDIHGLDAAKLADAASFPVYADRIRMMLTSSSKQTFLTGHNVSFDAARLTYEYQLLGEEPPALLLLDTKRLVPALGIGSHNSKLDEFAAAFKITNPAPHEANADALTTREVVLKAIDRLVASGISDLTPYAALPSRRAFYDDETGPELDAEHQAAHSATLTNRATREAALAVCLEKHCPNLHRRIEDCLTTPATAKQLLAWTTITLATPGLSRQQLGLVANGAVRVLNGWRQLVKTPNVEQQLRNAVAVLAAYQDWQPCGTDDDADKCDKCAALKPWRCRFVAVPKALVWSAMFNIDDQVPRAVAIRYLYNSKGVALGPGSSYRQIAALHREAALRGAAVAARTLRSLDERSLALKAIKALWKDGGRRTPGLTEVYAAIEEDNSTGRTLSAALKRAREVCSTGLAGAGPDPGWDRVRVREARLDGRLATATKPVFKDPYNTRPGRTSRFVKPSETPTLT